MDNFNSPSSFSVLGRDESQTENNEIAGRQALLAVDDIKDDWPPDLPSLGDKYKHSKELGFALLVDYIVEVVP